MTFSEQQGTDIILIVPLDIESLLFQPQKFSFCSVLVLRLYYMTGSTFKTWMDMKLLVR